MSALRNQSPGWTHPPHGTFHPCLTAILSAPNLKTAEKRSILSSWASDLHAVESKPWLRRVPGLETTIVLNDILRALQSLDSDNDDPPKGGGATMRLASQLWTGPHSIQDNLDHSQRARISAHQRNIARYRRILSTPLTEIERAYVHRRIDEERKALLSFGQARPAETTPAKTLDGHIP